MENIEKDLTKKRKIVHEKRKILRTKPMIIIRRYLLLFILLLTGIVTTWLGVYNLKYVEFIDRDNSYVRESGIKNSLKIYLGENFFLVNPDLVEETIKENLYVKNVEVEKIFPNKLLVDIEEYIPFLIFETENGECKFFSKEGTLLEIKKEINCKESSVLNNIIYLMGEDSLIITENDTEILYLIDDIYDISLVLNEFEISIISVGVSDDILNVQTDSIEIFIDTNQDINIQLARLLLVLKELEELNTRATSIDVRFKRPVLMIDN